MCIFCTLLYTHTFTHWQAHRSMLLRVCTTTHIMCSHWASYELHESLKQRLTPTWQMDQIRVNFEGKTIVTCQSLSLCFCVKEWLQLPVVLCVQQSQNRVLQFLLHKHKTMAWTSLSVILFYLPFSVLYTLLTVNPVPSNGTTVLNFS